VPGFGPAAEALLFWQKDPKPLTPRPFLSEWTDANHRRAGQLAALKQGPPSDVSVRPGERAAGVGQWEGEGPQGIPCGMVASTGMIKNQKPLEIILNNYRGVHAGIQSFEHNAWMPVPANGCRGRLYHCGHD